MPADLVIYALITAGLIFWLRSILGTKHGEERDRPVPFLQGDSEDHDKGEVKSGNAVALIEELTENKKGNMAIDGHIAERGLIDIAGFEKDFDVYKFLQAAQDAFVFVVESFAEGDRETLKDLLGPEVYAAFDSAIIQREKAGETMETEISAIKKSTIIEARVENKAAFITVRFLAEERSVLRDDSGEILSGHPDKVTQMRDIWTFSRPIKSRDPRWLVVETREDMDGDNESIPNSH
ncbi:MAG: Tim44/TimA family putative adaptor protein [Alphaproteobacteria bacterium]|nr:Tim44/TimA family putative adaptor protein [Alphaproteobacteria bacterium]